MTCRPYLTTEKLEGEYAAWGDANRNAHDLRFGQYIYCKYSHVPDDAFNTEDKQAAFEQIRDALKEYQR